MKTIVSILIVIITSLFYFPFECYLMPGVNTKMVLAVAGLVIYGYQLAKKQNAQFDGTITSVSVWGLLVSIVALISVYLNNTNDYIYVGYFVSMWVWLCGAYAVIESIRLVYGRATMRLLANFLIAVCVSQCILAQVIDSSVAVANWVDGFAISAGYMSKIGRLYGLGCALDVAGLKFCGVLILLAYFAINPSGKINQYVETSLYVLSFFVIAVLGSMISRTTSIGVIMALIYWLGVSVRKQLMGNTTKYLWSVLGAALIILLPVIVYLYHHNTSFNNHIQFAFEGFFSFVETGEWEVRSNDQLMGMWIWPDTLTTWIIGDGYFDAQRYDPFYIGPNFVDFYMGTDIGYCRFVWYFGIIGLLAFSGFFINCAYQCSKNNPKYSTLFWGILIINFIGWCKVSTDIFPIYAMLLFLNSPLEEPNDHLDSNQLYAE